MSNSVLQIRDLRVTFNTQMGELKAVRGIDVDVAPGEILGVVGESGSGKSVSFLAAMGLLPASASISGSVMLDGKELIGSKRKAIRSVRGKSLAMVFQDPLSALNPVHRVGDQIVEMIQSHQDMNTHDAEKRAVELLEIVGIPQPGERARQYPHEFSGGMRQRVVIAMAIANNPKVLIADEPTTALDVTVQAQILEVIQKVQQKFGTAVVLITHDLGVIARVADSVNVMYAGRNVESGSVQSIFDHPSHPYTRGLLSSLPHEELIDFSRLLVSRQTCLHHHRDVVSHRGVNLQLTRAMLNCHRYSHLMICLLRASVPLNCVLGDSREQHA